MFLMMQMGGGRRKRSTHEEEVYASRTIHICKGHQYILEVNVLILLIFQTVAIATKHMNDYFQLECQAPY